MIEIVKYGGDKVTLHIARASKTDHLEIVATRNGRTNLLDFLESEVHLIFLLPAGFNIYFFFPYNRASYPNKECAIFCF